MNGFSIDFSIPAVTVFLQGLLSFFSPCVLPLLPLYIGYLSGGTLQQDESGQRQVDRGKVIVNTVFFVLGISFAFFLLGLGMSAIGRFFGSHQMLFARIGGVIVILFGLYQMGLFGPSLLLSTERRLPLKIDRAAMSPLTALVMGFAFSFAWTPCVGPILASVLLLAGSAGSETTGFLLIGIYTLGFVIPFLAAGLFTTSLLALFKKHRGVVRWTQKICGVLLIFMGILMVTGQMTRVTGQFAALSGEEPAAAASAAEPEEKESGEQEKPEETPEPVEEDEEPEVYPAYSFELTDQYGEVHRLEDYRGKVIFLNFWATWCPPCRAEMPDIQKLYEKVSSDPESEVVVLGVAFPDYGSETDEKGIAEFLEQNGYTYPVLMDRNAELMAPFYISAYPTTFMIDKEGNIYGYVTGAISGEFMESIVAQTLEGSR